jgi:hypothetical protein
LVRLIKEQMMRVQSVWMRAVIVVTAVALAAPLFAQGAASTLDAAKARAFVGEWTLTIQGGRGPQERPLSIKDVGGKVAAELGGGRGGPITVTDITMPAADLILKWKQMGRGGEVEVMMTLTLKDGGLAVKQTLNGMDTEGTGVKKP